MDIFAFSSLSKIRNSPLACRDAEGVVAITDRRLNFTFAGRDNDTIMSIRPMLLANAGERLLSRKSMREDAIFRR